ncbi:MAG: sulfite exporter TauE/SafE family protein [Thaumarchaeota archaeon]|nr:sulfite exporter TauE/SafE family protein [Nitrososphaerota archaeon]
MLGHIINNEVDYLTLTVMGSAAMIGGYMGAKFTNKLSVEKLKMIIGIVLVIVALFMFSRLV